MDTQILNCLVDGKSFRLLLCSAYLEIVNVVATVDSCIDYIGV